VAHDAPCDPRAVAEFLKPFEGFHRVVQRRPVLLAAPYLCPANYWTIGFGILCDKNHPQITMEQGEAMLQAAVPAYISHALRLSPRLSGQRLIAIADFIFNLGPTRYAASTLRRRVNAQDWPGARTEIRRWVFGGGRKLPGLVLRRETEAALL
jgi:lysozyme